MEITVAEAWIWIKFYEGHVVVKVDRWCVQVWDLSYHSPVRVFTCVRRRVGDGESIIKHHSSPGAAHLGPRAGHRCDPRLGIGRTPHLSPVPHTPDWGTHCKPFTQPPLPLLSAALRSRPLKQAKLFPFPSVSSVSYPRCLQSGFCPLTVFHPPYRSLVLLPLPYIYT